VDGWDAAYPNRGGRTSVNQCVLSIDAFPSPQLLGRTAVFSLASASLQQGVT
jgi:hypothetical protein